MSVDATRNVDVAPGPEQDLTALVLADLLRMRRRDGERPFSAEEVAGEVVTELSQYVDAPVRTFIPLLVRKAVVQRLTHRLPAVSEMSPNDLSRT